MSLCIPSHAQPPDVVPDAGDGFQPQPPPPPPERVYTLEEIARDMGAPTTVTLHLHDVSARDVFNAVTAQTGLRFYFNGQPNAKVSVDCDQAPLYDALPAILTQTGTMLPNGFGESRIMLQMAQSGWATKFLSGPRAVAGPFVIELYRSTLTKTRQERLEQPFNPAPPDAQDAGENLPLNFQGRVLCDPKLQMLSNEIELQKADDQAGKSLLPANNFGGTNAYGSNGTQTQFGLQLKEADPGVKTIKTLSGAMKLKVVERSEKWEIPDALEAGTVTRRFGPAGKEVAITLKITKSDGAYANGYEVNFTAEGHDPLLYQMSQAILSAAKWQDPQGKPVDCSFGGLNGGGGNEKVNYRTTYRFPSFDQQIADPVTLVLSVPTDIRLVHVPFEFSDVPLPSVVDTPPPPRNRVYTVEEIARDMGAPTTLTLHRHDVAPKEIFDDIAAQTGMRFIFNGQPPEKTVTVDCDHTPVYAALADIFERIQYTPSNGNYGNRTMLEPAAHNNAATKYLSGPQSVAGPFIVELANASLTKSHQGGLEQPVDPAHPPVQYYGENLPLTVTGHLYADPKLQVVSTDVTLQKAQDDTGQSLIPENAGYTNYGGMQSQFNIQLREPAAGAKSLKTLSGALRLKVLGHSADWEIPDPVKVGTVTKRFGPAGAQIALTLKAEKKGEGNSLSVTLTLEGDDQSLWQQAQLILGQAKWQDVQGKPIDFNFGGLGGGGNNTKATYTTTYQLVNPNEPIAEPTTLILSIPTEMRTVLVPFNFTDIPLP